MNGKPSAVERQRFMRQEKTIAKIRKDGAWYACQVLNWERMPGLGCRVNLQRASFSIQEGAEDVEHRMKPDPQVR